MSPQAFNPSAIWFSEFWIKTVAASKAEAGFVFRWFEVAGLSLLVA
ncbi:MAG: hypothetical protein AAGA67_07095 [Cyanobacteria bacterium P01_F01_bin.153]